MYGPLEWSPDGQWLAARYGAGGDYVRLWKADGTPGLVRGVEDPTCISWSPDGQSIASVDAFGRVHLWSLDGTLDEVLEGHTARVRPVAWSPDGTRLASGGDDNTVRLWRVDGKAGPVLEGHTEPVRSVTWSPDGKWLASASDDKTIRLWHADGNKGPVLEGHLAAVREVAWSPDGKWLASVNAKSTIRLWESSGKAGSVLEGDGHSPRGLAWTADSRLLASADSNGKVRLWRPDDLSETAVNVGHELRSFALSPDGKRFGCGAADGLPELYEIDGTPILSLQKSSATIRSVAWSPDGCTLATGVDDAVGLWEAHGTLQSVTMRHDGFVTSVAWSPDGHRLVSGSADETARIWEVDGRPGPVMKGHEGSVSDVAWQPGGRYVASAGSDRTVRLWEAADGQLRNVLEGHTGAVTAITWSPDGQELASGSTDKTVRQWRADASAGPVMKGHKVLVRDVAWSPDGTRLASVGGWQIRLWKQDGLEESVLEQKRANRLVWAPDGRRFAVNSGGTDVVKLWTIQGQGDRTLVSSLLYRVSGLAWASDGREIASGNIHGIIGVWDVDTGEADWCALVLKESKYITFSGAGQILHGDPEVVKNELAYMVQRTEDGPLELLTPAEFQELVKSNPPKTVDQAPPDTGVPSSRWVFTQPVNLGPIVNSNHDDGSPHLSWDGLTLHFSSDRPGGQGDRDLWMCTRTSVGESFGKPVNLGTTVNSNSVDSAPHLSADSLTLVFASTRPGAQGSEPRDLWMCTRASVDEPFEEPVNLGPIVNSDAIDYHPTLTADGLTLVFNSNRPGGLGETDLWMCTRASVSDSFGKPVNLGPTVNSSNADGCPALSADELTLVFMSERPNRRGGSDLWMCTRPSRNEPFGQPFNLGPTVNSGHEDSTPALSADGQTLFFQSNRPGGHGDGDLWMTRIEQRGAPAQKPGK